MNTIEQPEATGRGARKSTSGSSARPDLVDVVLLLVTILALMSAAAGIAIGFPLALEVVSTQAHAAIAVYPAPQARSLAVYPAPQAWSRLEPEEESEEYDEPLIVDDVRSEERMYAAAEIAS